MTVRYNAKSKEMPPGGIIDCPGNSVEFKTGDWRTHRPVWDKEKCVHCMLCVMFCPDFCIPVEEKEDKKAVRTETDFNYCKGCGICAQVCPVKCIKMEKEE